VTLVLAHSSHSAFGFAIAGILGLLAYDVLRHRP
jgi:hypothetical protein